MYFEDYEVGQIFDREIESAILTEEEIIENASKYDPRDIHCDKNLAEKSRFKGIISSGIFSIMTFWSNWVKTGIDADGMICGVSIEGAKWLKAVYPNVRYDIKVKIVDKKIRKENIDGFVTYQMTVENPEKDLVLDFLVTGLVKCKRNS